jgi:intraflagellar transport protein 80
LQLEARKVRVQDVVHDSYEDLQLRDRVLDMALGYGFLVIATSAQAYVYSVNNWNTPHILDLRQGAAINLVLLSPRHFLLLDSAVGLTVYSYEGRQLSQPRFQGLRPDCLSRASISLAPDCVAVIDHTDSKCKFLVQGMPCRLDSRSKGGHTLYTIYPVCGRDNSAYLLPGLMVAVLCVVCCVCQRSVCWT